MKKLTLDLDELQVDSFDTTPLSETRGTVLGQSETTGAQIICDEETNGYENSCNTQCVGTYCASCQNTCETCAGQATCAGAYTCAQDCTCVCC